MYNWVTLLYSRDCHNIVNLPHFNEKKNWKIKKILYSLIPIFICPHCGHSTLSRHHKKSWELWNINESLPCSYLSILLLPLNICPVLTQSLIPWLLQVSQTHNPSLAPGPFLPWASQPAVFIVCSSLTVVLVVLNFLTLSSSNIADSHGSLFLIQLLENQQYCKK